MTIESCYSTALQKIQKTFCDGLGDLVTGHCNWIINKYGGWKRYPRKIKKSLKRKGWWSIKDLSPVNKGDFHIKIKNHRNEERKFKLDFSENFLEDIRNEFCAAARVPKEMLKYES